MAGFAASSPGFPLDLINRIRAAIGIEGTTQGGNGAGLHAIRYVKTGQYPCLIHKIYMEATVDIRWLLMLSNPISAAEADQDRVWEYLPTGSTELITKQGQGASVGGVKFAYPDETVQWIFNGWIVPPNSYFVIQADTDSGAVLLNNRLEIYELSV